MISASDRKEAVKLINEAVSSGAALKKACAELEISERTYYRWIKLNNKYDSYEDRRPIAEHPEPANKITSEERQQMKMLKHRGRANEPHTRPISTHVATSPNQVWMWDITYLNGPIKGQFYYLYLFTDLFSRDIVGWEVWETEDAREWCANFVKWYRFEHHHSGIKFLTPAEVHSSKGQEILDKRHKLYEKAKEQHPERWNGRATRDWTLPDEVYLNPAQVSEKTEGDEQAV